MKIRQGFVSNSSSSSFVCLGVNLEDYPQLKEKFWDNYNGEITDEGNKTLPKNTECNYYESNGIILGWRFAGGSSDDGSFACKEIEINDLIQYANNFQKITGVKPKLMGGCYRC